ncbi:hypothetical protein RND81_07G119200 [Saponaria officinalis]|uniref:Uncharacterized protein n=1 Tax=Saponaria officinalis TaxID=3572 RepID=A0AAW1JPK7_SAPOF
MENNNTNNNNNNNMMIENNNNGFYPMIMIPTLSHHHHHNHHHNKLCCSSASCPSTAAAAAAAAAGCYDHLMENNQQQQQSHGNNIININNSCNNNNNSNNNNCNIKAQIMAHPHYPRLLSSFLNCQKVGAPPEVVARLEEVEAMTVSQGGGGGGGGYIGEDPSLDQFMEAYCEMLSKYEQELSKPFKEAMLFLSNIESQFKALNLSSSSSDSPSFDLVRTAYYRNASSEEDIDGNENLIDPSAEDRELKGQLLRKYSGYLGSLRQEFMKKRKKGKLPKEARQQLLDWWSRHYKWPYPSESQKLALAESTGLDQKQINNWFINQRKRHWKPSEDMQFVVMDAATTPHSHGHPHYGYMDHVLGNPFPMDVSSTLM